MKFKINDYNMKILMGIEMSEKGKIQTFGYELYRAGKLVCEERCKYRNLLDCFNNARKKLEEIIR